jgi:hypothetical protein
MRYKASTAKTTDTTPLNVTYSISPLSLYIAQTACMNRRG